MIRNVYLLNDQIQGRLLQHLQRFIISFRTFMLKRTSHKRIFDNSHFI